jgi:(E)-4-hydroxy-3-methylbut-2-enyl-diphosphate synthase
LIDAGADYVRITTPAIRDAENLVQIKKLLKVAGYTNPLVADVHFNPAVAEVAARIVEKVRINPGNYIDKKRFEHIENDDTNYKLELERVHERVLPLLVICREYGTAIRIGVNHGSLSDRIMSRFGDTPEGMAESAMEFLRIFSAEGFHQSVISMKSSNTRVMVHSTRLLIKKMLDEGMHYPVHLGVTEAGEGEDGIIKSAAGIGTLLGEGIGETIRVSLTGDPVQEIPVAKEIVSYFTRRDGHDPITIEQTLHFSMYNFQRRESVMAGKAGGSLTPIVVTNDQPSSPIASEDVNYAIEAKDGSFKTERISIKTVEAINKVNVEGKILVITSDHIHFAGEIKAILAVLQEKDIPNPVIIHKRYDESSFDILQIKAGCDFGSLLIDGIADGIWIENADSTISPAKLYQLSLNLLQASRVRMSKTEYISCPSCGRTLFDLTSTLARIREQTSHLKHLKIGVMGCIVNGPGEMADADYGYVGSGPGKITLYRNKEIIKKNIPEEIAVSELIKLIKENGDWGVITDY